MLLDTSVVVNLLRGEGATVERAGALAGEALISAITADEIVRGIREGEHEHVVAILSWQRLVPVGAAEAWLAGGWRREFAGRGVRLSQADCLIAASAMTQGARLATANPRDFPMAGLEVEDWRLR